MWFYLTLSSWTSFFRSLQIFRVQISLQEGWMHELCVAMQPLTWKHPTWILKSLFFFFGQLDWNWAVSRFCSTSEEDDDDPEVCHASNTQPCAHLSVQSPHCPIRLTDTCMFLFFYPPLRVLIFPGRSGSSCDSIIQTHPSNPETFSLTHVFCSSRRLVLTRETHSSLFRVHSDWVMWPLRHSLWGYLGLEWGSNTLNGISRSGFPSSASQIMNFVIVKAISGKLLNTENGWKYTLWTSVVLRQVRFIAVWFFYKLNSSMNTSFNRKTWNARLVVSLPYSWLEWCKVQVRPVHWQAACHPAQWCCHQHLIPFCACLGFELGRVFVCLFVF